MRVDLGELSKLGLLFLRERVREATLSNMPLRCGGDESAGEGGTAVVAEGRID